jgi:hypothetical protein
MIADLTGGNPNVLYEVGIRHAVGKPCVQIIENGHKIPFDVADIRTLVVESGSFAGIERAVSELSLLVDAAMSASVMRDDARLVELLSEVGFDDWSAHSPLRSDPSGGLLIPTLILSELQGKIAKSGSAIHPPRWTKLDRFPRGFAPGHPEKDGVDDSVLRGPEEYPKAA